MFLLTVELFYQKVDKQTKLLINKKKFEVIEKDGNKENKDKTKLQKINLKKVTFYFS